MSLELLTLREVATKARIGRTTLAEMLARGDGPRVTRIGGRVFVRADRLDDWIESCTEASAPVSSSSPQSGAAILAHAQGRMRAPEVRAP